MAPPAPRPRGGRSAATAPAAAAAAADPAAVASPTNASSAPGGDGCSEVPPTSPASASKPAKKKMRAIPPPSPQSQAALAGLRYKAQRIAQLLGRLYPNPPIPVDHADKFQLLCSVLLSAQTTDKKVNECTPALFRLAPNAASMAAAELGAIQACIRSLGLAPTKAKNLKAMSQMLVDLHDGEVPASLTALEELPGVGHKTASVVMCQAFGQDAFPVDTHIHRLAQRWGLTTGASVEQTEADLKHLFPQELWRDLHLQIIFFGREKCPAPRHDPVGCPICSWAAVPPYNKAGVSPVKASAKKAASGGGGGSGSPRPRKKAAAGGADNATPPSKRAKKAALPPAQE